jgi:energy-converting hydrogenase Eha subunit H
MENVYERERETGVYFFITELIGIFQQSLTHSHQTSRPSKKANNCCQKHAGRALDLISAVCTFISTVCLFMFNLTFFLSLIRVTQIAAMNFTELASERDGCDFKQALSIRMQIH